MKRAVSLLFICLSLCCMQSQAAEPGATVQIKCNDISDSGIGSSYTSHTFSLLDDSDNISACQWNFYIKKSDQTFLNIKSESGRSFTIDPVESDNDYFINAQGEYEGRVECEYTQDGKQYTASPFHVSLELKPIIISIDDLQIIKEGYNFRVRFTVTYAGSDHLQICLEEETNLVSRYTTVAEPDIAHVLTSKLTTFEYTWVTVIVENQYGKAEHVMEFAPDYQGGINLPEASDGVAGVNEISVKDKRIHFESEFPMNVAIYSLDGKCVYQAAALQHADIDLSHLVPQLLIINISDINSSKTDKIFLR